ncbi:MAG: T9SS type A sorting domain-containing protein [Bacteroidales bacterium]|nr:T9SS type A sorting domain-containing protein [Bacteroidales bacterium]
MKKIFYFILTLCLVPALFVVAQNTHNGTRDDNKYVVIEELTGTWCQWCPRGHVIGRELSQDYENIIFVAIHTGDNMEYNEYFTASGLTGAPTANVNRKYLGAVPAAWEGHAQTEMALNPPAYVTVSTTYNEATRELEATVSAEFVENLSGDYRLGGLVVEDGVTGPSPAYDQSNQYAGGGNGPMGGYENLPSPVPANMIAYDHVARHLLGGYDGEEGSLPENLVAGQTYSWTFYYALPENYDPEYVRVAGWLVDQNNGHILNAGKSQYLPGFDNGKPHFITAPPEGGFVGTEYKYFIFTADPEDDDLTIIPTDIPDWLNYVQTAQNTVHTAGTLSGTPTEPGTYSITLSVSDGNWIIVQSYDLVVEESQGAAWELIGTPGFSSYDAQQTVTKVADDGTVYVAYQKYNVPTEVMKFDGADWSMVGPPVGTADSHMDMDLDSDGNPWVAFNDVAAGTKTVVKKFDGTSWQTVGSPVSVGASRSLNMAFDNEGVPYVAFYEQDMGTQGFVYKLEDGTWIMVGDGPISSDQALFFDLDFDSNNTPHLLWAKISGGYSYYSRVSKFVNNEWLVLGGGDITPNYTYFYHSLAIGANDQVYVSIAETIDVDLNVYELTGDNWSEITAGYDLIGESHQLAIDSENKLYLGFMNATAGSQTSVMAWDGNVWTSVGPLTISGGASYQSMAVANDDTPYISYADTEEGGKVTTQAYFTSGVPLINIDPLTIVYDTTEVGQAREHTVLVSNFGEMPLVISSISTNNAIFSPNFSSLTIEAGGSEELIITFAPEEIQWYEGEITLLCNDPLNPTIIIQVSGYGINTVGMDEVNDIGKIFIYPNPANERVQIESTSVIEKVQLVNIAGQVVLEETTVGNKKEINTSHLDAGIYFIKVFSQNNVITRKLVIE